MNTSKRIAVIGAGAIGLSAVKCCKEVGLEPICFEKSDDLGGLWKYKDDAADGSASVMQNTVMNSSKETSAFSDFPPPKEFPVFLHHTQMYEYLSMYAKHFDLVKHIRYHKEVIKVQPATDYEKTGRWLVCVQDLRTMEREEDEFDAVMVCIGHHIYPKIPSFPGEETFSGVILHSHAIKDTKLFKEKRVLVVGLGSSAADVAVASAIVAKQVYISTRSGAWIYSRLGINGRPYDMDFNSRFKSVIGSLMPFNYRCTKLEKKLNKNFDHDVYGVKPERRVLCYHPTINGLIPGFILSGRIVVKKDIERIEKNGVVFTGEGKITEIDVIILATGYMIKFPFLGDLIPVKDNKVDLYKYMIPPTLTHPTLAIIGLVQALGPFYPIGEMQSRWFCQLLLGNIKLPSISDRLTEIKNRNDALAKRYTNSTRHTIQVEWIPYMDQLSEAIGVKPNMWKMALMDTKLFLACFDKPCLPYQFRLQGPHSWNGARAAILGYEERIFTPLNESGKVISKKKENTPRNLFLLLLLFGGIFIIRIRYYSL